jgi:hypothetical protein
VEKPAAPYFRVGQKAYAMDTLKGRQTYTGLNGVISHKEVLMLLMVHTLFLYMGSFFPGCCNFKLVTVFLFCVDKGEPVLIL